MSYSASPGAGRPIAIDATVGRAYGSVFGNWRLAVGFAWVPVALVLGVEAFALIVGGSGVVGRTLSSLAGIIGFLLFGTTFTVRWCRFILLGERQKGELFPPGWRLTMVVTVKFCLIILAGAVILLLIARLTPQSLHILICTVGGLVIVFLLPRLLLAFPAAAIERPLTLRASWDRTEGDYWRFLACALLCYLPLAMIAELIGWVGAATAFGAIWIALEAVRLAVTFIDIAVLYALLAEAYRGIAGARTDEAAAD